MSDDDPYNVFDWHFSDASSEGARLIALENRKEQTKILINLINADSIIHFALFEKLPENHPIGELWLETQTDLFATIYLAYGGFFRQALTVLRAWFEIAIDGVYFSDHWGQHDERYEQWRRGERKIPTKIEDFAVSFSKRTNMLILTDEPTFIAKIRPIYTFLSQQTHAQGLDNLNLQDGRDNVPRYLPKSYDIWYEKVLESFDTMCYLYRIFFTKEIASYLNESPSELERLKITQKYLGILMPNFNELINDVLKIN